MYRGTKWSILYSIISTVVRYLHNFLYRGTKYKLRAVLYFLPKCTAVHNKTDTRYFERGWEASGSAWLYRVSCFIIMNRGTLRYEV